MLVNYCKPIPFEDCQTCTVEFADTPGTLLTCWRIRSEDGQVRTGFCEEGATKVFYDGPVPGDFDGIKAADLKDCRALKATWPTWEAMRERNPGQEERDRAVAEMHGWLKTIKGKERQPDSDPS